MANLKISQLAAGAPAQATDVLPIDRAGANFSLQVSDVLAAPATTQTPFNNSTALATTAYVDNVVKGANMVYSREDFISNSSNAALTTAGANFPCDTAWVGTTLLVNGSLVAQQGTFANPGLMIATTGSTGTGDAVILYKCSNSVGTVGNLGGNAGWEANIIFLIQSTANIGIRAGFVASGQMVADPPSGGMWVRYDTASADTNFTFEARSGGISTTSTTNSIAADTNFHHFRIRSIVAGTVLFSVDGGVETAISTNLPTTNQMMVFQLFTRTSSAKSATYDFFSYEAVTSRT